MRKLLSVALTLVVALAVTLPVTAQETGSVSGTVNDPDGAPLPGVAVTIGGSLVPASTVYTQANGVYRFPVLPPGDDYTLTFAMDGFKTVIQEGLPVRVGANTDVTVRMELSSVEETVTVTGTTPIVDVKDTGISNNVTEEYMQSIPSARDPWVMMQQTAGFQVDTENVGGSESGQQSGFTANGNRAGDMVWTYDGAEVTDMSAIGASPMYYDFEAFEEISFTTGGMDPSIQVGGIRVNFVTKRGGNNWRGSSRFYITDGALQSRNVGDPSSGELVGDFTADELYPGYIGNSIENIKDWGAEVGGPLVRDRVFAWGAFGKQDIKQNVGTSPDNTQLKNWHGKANVHLGDKAVFNYTFVRADKTKQGRGASATRPPATTWNQGGPSPVHTAKLQYTLNDNNYLEASFNRTGLGFFLEPQGGRDIQAAYDLATGAWQNSYQFYTTERPLYNARIDGNTYLAGASVDHEIKYGYSFRDAQTSSVIGFGQGAVAVFSEGAPAEAWLIQDAVDNFVGQRHSFYVGDTLSANRLTVNAGLRYDRQTSRSLASSVEAHPLAPNQFPAQSFDGYDPGFGWNSVSPRLGLTYDLSGNSRTILRLSAARYYAQMGNFELHLTNTTGGPEMDFGWSDANGNGQVDPGETGDLLWVSPGFDPANPNAPRDVVINETTAPTTDELIVGLEHEINRSFGVGMDFTYKNNNSDTWTIRQGENDPGFWTPVTLTDDDYGLTYQVYEPVGPRSSTQVYGMRYGWTHRYVGLTAFMTKRYSDNWMANASFTWANPTQHLKPGSYTDPTNLQYINGETFAPEPARTPSGDAYAGASRWFFKASGMYSLPAGFSVAGFFQMREGNVQRPYIRSDNRANGAGRANVDIATFGSVRYPTFWLLDLRVEKQLQLGDAGRLHFIVDAFNVTNQKTILGQYDQVNSSAYNRITDVVQGRSIRFGTRLVFR